MAGISENKAYNASGTGPSSRCTLNFNFVVLMIIYFISFMIWFDAQDHFVDAVYEHVVILAGCCYDL
jgi:hypothetical protein